MNKNYEIDTTDFYSVYDVKESDTEMIIRGALHPNCNAITVKFVKDAETGIERKAWITEAKYKESLKESNND